ncbi:MAG: murein L,D-transpeptidase catalytic domain family protein [Alphaproteobacteria bacterium]
MGNSLDIGTGLRSMARVLMKTKSVKAGAAAGMLLASALAGGSAEAFSRTDGLASHSLDQGSAGMAPPIPHTLLAEALSAYRKHAHEVRNARYISIADFSRHSSQERLFILDLETGTHEALLVAHGQGSDRNHDGFADVFSNEVDSHMSSLGAYVTLGTYQGKHGLSMRLRGLEPTNDRARERAIVMHGADYVSRERDTLGRSWGCPAIEPHLVEKVLPRLAGGTFLYITR